MSRITMSIAMLPVTARPMIVPLEMGLLVVSAAALVVAAGTADRVITTMVVMALPWAFVVTSCDDVGEGVLNGAASVVPG